MEAAQVIITAGRVKADEFAGWADEIESKVFVSMEVQHRDSGQWLTFERCACKQGVKSTISAHALKAAGVRGMGPDSLVVLWVRHDPAQERQLRSFEVVEADTVTPSIVSAGPADWELGSFDGTIDPVGITSDE